MIRRLSLVAAAFLALIALPSSVPAGSILPEPCLRSTLCNGLIEVYEFEEGSDSNRYGAFGGILREGRGQSFGTAAGKTDGVATGNAVDFDGTANYLWANGGAGLPRTISFWIFVDAFPAAGASASIISRRDTTHKGPEVYLQTITGATDNQVCIQYFSILDGTNVGKCSADLATATWYFVVVGIGTKVDGGGVINGVAPFVSIDAAAASYGSTINAGINPGSMQVRIGAGTSGTGPDTAATNFFNGRLDQMVFWGRELTAAEISLLRPSGNRLAYPFITE